MSSAPIITVGYIMQVLISLAIVVALIYVSAKFLLPKLKVTTTGKFIEVMDRVFLEPQVTAYILKVRKSAWLVVTSNKQVAKIDKVEIE